MSDLKERARARRAAFEKNAYHQGGGGVNDPQTYPKEPADPIRDGQDKQMVGEGLESGNDGLAGNDLALKKKLLRAELEERRLRRHALLARGEPEILTLKDGTKVAVTKGPDGKPTIQAVDDEGLEAVAYHQGGGGVNDPQTYPKEEADKIRDTQDKQMVGEGMEPGSDGLAGNDLALKQKLLRAEFKYPRTKTGSPDRAKAHWDVYANDKLVLSATGEQIYGEDLARDDYWAHLSSTDYGRRIISEIRREGLGKVAYLLTGKVVTAQDPMPPMPPLAGAPGAPPAPPAPPVEPPPMEEKPGAESTKSRVDEALAEVEKKLGDLKEVLKEEDKGEEGGKEELPPIEVGEGGEVAKAALELRAALDDSGDELAILSEVLGKRLEAGMASGSEMDELMRLAQESLEASAEFCREAGLVIEAKKGKMPEGLKKALEEKEKGKGKGKKEEKEEKDEEEGEKKGKGKKEEKEEKGKGKEEKGKGKGKKDEEDEEKEEKGKKGKKSEAELVLEKMLKARATKRRELVRLAIGEEEYEEKEHEVQEELEEGLEGLEGLVEELEDIDMKEGKENDAQYLDEGEEDPLVAELLAELGGEGLEPEGGAFEEEALAAEDEEMASLASRRAWREKVAAEVGSKYQLKLDPAADMDTDMVPKAHPQRGTTLSGLSTKPSDEGAHVEGIDEIKAKIMKQVETLPQVREAVAKLGDMLKSGKLALADLTNDAKLRALAVDPEAAKYWKQYFGEGDPASKQFGQDLSKEFAQKKAAAEADNYKLKLRRAVDLALDMQDKGLISQGRDAMNRQVDDVMKFDEPAFEAFKRALSRTTSVTKVAGRSEPALQVGISEEVEPTTLSNQLDRLWLPKRK
jgi:hypothetical protein